MLFLIVGLYLVLWLTISILCNNRHAHGASLPELVDTIRGPESINLTPEQTDFCKKQLSIGIQIMDGVLTDWQEIEICWRYSQTCPKFNGAELDGEVTYYYGVAAVPMIEPEMDHPSVVAYLFCFEKVDRDPGLKFGGAISFYVNRGL